MATFAELGIPFPLYRGQVKECSDYHGPGVSSISGVPSDHCFKLGIGGSLVLECRACRQTVLHNCGDAGPVVCSACSTETIAQSKGKFLITYEELRQGLGLIVKDTEIGMISYEQYQLGQSHGSPYPDSLHGFDVIQNADGWYCAKLDRQDMHELLRTPNYVTWQGERWLFHQRKPMIFLGEWTEEDFERNRGSQGLRDYYLEVLGADFSDLYDHRDGVCKYIFTSVDGGVIRGHYDFS
jgi:hypothetical protein